MNGTQTILINPLQSGASNFNAQEVGGVLYFTVDRGSQGKEYWKTDGTAEGTVFISHI